jgi:hypothetical protein
VEGQPAGSAEDHRVAGSEAEGTGWSAARHAADPEQSRIAEL